MNLESTMVSLRRHKRLRPCSESSSGLARPPGFCDNGTALQTSALERPHNVHLTPSNNVNQSEELRQNTAFLASKEAEIAALASLKTLESQIAEERRLWGEARSKLEADLCNSRVRLVALESELKVSKESLANVQREFHDAREAWKDMAEEALIDMREDHEQEKERLVEMLMAKSIKAKEAEKAALASLKTLESQIAEERRLWGEARSKLEADLCNSRVRLVALESELKFSKESLANVQREFHDAREAWEHMVEEALNDMREDHEQEKERLVEMLMAKSIKAKEPTQESPSQAIPQDFRGQINKGPDEVPNT